MNLPHGTCTRCTHSSCLWAVSGHAADLPFNMYIGAAPTGLHWDHHAGCTQGDTLSAQRPHIKEHSCNFVHLCPHDSAASSPTPSPIGLSNTYVLGGNEEQQCRCLMKGFSQFQREEGRAVPTIPCLSQQSWKYSRKSWGKTH